VFCLPVGARVSPDQSKGAERVGRARDKLPAGSRKVLAVGPSELRGAASLLCCTQTHGPRRPAELGQLGAQFSAVQFSSVQFSSVQLDCGRQKEQPNWGH